MQREIDSFHEALELPPDQRAAFLSQRHADDPALVERVLRLLDAHEKAESDAVETSALATPDPTTRLAQMPERIGPYRILERLGEGGMGIVYAAEQTEPFRRRVAVKVIKLGMDTREVIARFEAERQALAMLDHPGVAKALDAGATEQGRPYFVMELVKGLSLVEYCTKHRLRLADRLRLFADVCAAIQHAHQKGIIHRDLKPSNILVSVQEGRAVPKVIDFGVAKATASRLTERTVFTEQGRLIGTPEYMSPEQAEMSGLDIDTRTDVYSLGVVLYELLTGALPFDPKALRAGGYPEILRIIREVDPPRPSTRLHELARASQPIPYDTGTLARSVRGELDWIVMRAIEKDRTRRYPTASALGDDIERFLTDRPVLAGPPSVLYSLQKFIKRHRFAAALVGLALLSAIIGVSGLTAGLIRAREAEALASRRADNAQAAAGFLERVLFQADPEFGGGSMSLLQVMDNASGLIQRDLADYPEVEASVRESLGVAYRRRSKFAAAAPHLRRSLELRREHLGERSLETAHSEIALANLVFEYEGDVDRSSRLLERAYECYRAEGLEDTGAEAWLLLDIGIVHVAGDRLAAARTALERCRDLLATNRGSEHPDVSRPIRGLAFVAMLEGDADRAEALARTAVALCEGEGAVYIGARARQVLARVLLERGGFDEAERLLDEARRQFADTVGERHLRIAELLADRTELLLHQRDFAEAAVVAAECEQLCRALLHQDHWEILEAELLAQRAAIGSGDHATAETRLQTIAEAIGQRLGTEHRLFVQAAAARLDCAVAAGDETLAGIRRERLQDLVARRSERLRREREQTGPTDGPR